jgi:hypothetical protein
MAVEDLTGQHISSTYQRLLQVSSSGEMANGTGSLYIPPLSVTASFAISASYALSSSHEIVKEISSSHADTASYVNTLNQDVFINGDLTLTGSLLASGSSFTFIGPIFAEDVSLSGSFSGSFEGNFSGSADLPDLTNSIGITPFVYDGGNTATVQVSGSDILNTNTVTKWSGNAFNNTNITDNGTSVDINSLTNITGSLTVSGSNSIINTQELQFNVDHIKSGHSTGRMFWDDDNKTITVDMQGSDVRLQLGQEEHVYAFNNSGVTINNGDAVRISGANGANVTVTKAIAAIKSFKDSTEEDQILGVATEQISDNKFGYITTFGAVRDLDTSAFNEGDILYLSNITSGSYTNIRPPAPFFEARVGTVQVANPTEGIVLVRPQEPIFLTDISQVTGSGVIVGGTSYLCYDDNTEIIGFTNSFTGSFSGTASYAENSNLLDGRDSTTFTSTSSFNSFTSSYYIDSASFDTRIISNSSSISILSSSYLESSASFASDILTNNSSIALLSSSFLIFSSSYNTGSFTGSFFGEATLDTLTVNGPLTFKTYRLTSSAYTASIDDYRIGVKYTLTGSVEIQLPLISAAGELEYKFKDEEGNAKKQNITIIASGSDLIDGDVNAILNRNYMAIGLYNDGVSNWYIE